MLPQILHPRSIKPSYFYIQNTGKAAGGKNPAKIFKICNTLVHAFHSVSAVFSMWSSLQGGGGAPLATLLSSLIPNPRSIPTSRIWLQMDLLLLLQIKPKRR